jgi:hypothetical protein
MPRTGARHRAHHLDPTKRSARAVRDEVLKALIQRIWPEHDQAYGSRKVWKQMGREQLREARCRVRRLMRELGLVGVLRGRAWPTTTQPAAAAARPADLVDRHFVAMRPNQLWVSDFTYVATWVGSVYVAFVINVFARRIVGWRVSASLRTDFVLDALEQALYARCDDTVGDLVHHSDRVSSICRCATPNGWPMLALNPPSGAAATRTTLQGGGHSAEKPVADARGGGICDPDVGGLVQSSKAARTDRVYPAGRVRSALP